MCMAARHRRLQIASSSGSSTLVKLTHRIGVCEYLCADGRRMYANVQQAVGFVTSIVMYQLCDASCVQSLSLQGPVFGASSQ
jgi:hypothetical protein